MEGWIKVEIRPNTGRDTQHHLFSFFFLGSKVDVRSFHLKGLGFLSLGLLVCLSTCLLALGEQLLLESSFKPGRPSVIQSTRI